ncbi:MAG: nucleotidyltransferase family protein [Bacillota bacterium]|jgi:predicted nucleotidyltransferase
MDYLTRERLKKAWLARTERQKHEEQELRRKAREKAAAVARHLKENYEVGSVYLYGSLVWGNHYSPLSDIDLLIVGFGPIYSYWKMVAEAQDIAAPLAISVVLEEDASLSLRQKVLTKGEIL